MIKLLGLVILLMGLIFMYYYLLLGIFILLMGIIILYQNIESKVKIKGIIGVSLLIGLELIDNIINFYGYLPNDRTIIAMFFIVITFLSLILFLKYIKGVFNNFN